MKDRGTFLKIAIAVVLLGALIFFSNSGTIKSIRGGVLWTLKPFLGAARFLNQSLGLSDFSQEEMSQILQENERLKAAKFAYEELRAENQALKKALRFDEETVISLRGARVLLYSKEFGKEFLVIGQGKKDGVREDDVVVDAERVLVGVVREVGESFAKVSVASNLGETFEVELIPLRVRALARGVGNRGFLMELVPQDTPIRRGDFLVAVKEKVGDSLLLGEITGERAGGGASFKNAGAILLSRPEFLKEVFIIARP